MLELLIIVIIYVYKSRYNKRIFANIRSYFFMERYTNWKVINGFILSAIFSLAIVIYIKINTLMQVQ